LSFKGYIELVYCICACRLELTKLDSVTEWLVDLRSLTDSECMCVLQGKSLTADTAEVAVSPPKLVSGQLLWHVGFNMHCMHCNSSVSAGT